MEEIEGVEEIESIERIDGIDGIEDVEEIEGGEGFPRPASKINSGGQPSGPPRPLENTFRLGATFSSPEYPAYV
jgi:hypothetical protein